MSAHIKKLLFLGCITFTSTILIGLGLFSSLGILYPTDKINLREKKIALISEKTLFHCKEEKSIDKEDCYRDQLTVITKMYGMVTASTILAKMQEKDISLISCHRIGHHIGRASYERNSKDFWKILDTINTNLCSMGMLHGFLEAYITDHPETKINKEFIEYICKETKPGNTCSYLHLLGHMILVFNYADFSTSMSVCGELREVWLYDCYDGIFMEHFHKTTLSEHGLAEKPDINNEYISKHEQVCLFYTDVPEKACWRNMGSLYYVLHGYKPNLILQKCSQSKNQEANTMCYQSAVAILSIALNKNKDFYTPEETLALCKVYAPDDLRHKGCVGNILSIHIYNSKNSVSRMRLLCKLEPEELQAWCFESIDSYLQKILRGQEGLR